MTTKLRRDLETAARALSRAGDAKSFTGDDLALVQRIALDAGALVADWQGRLLRRTLGEPGRLAF